MDLSGSRNRHKSTGIGKTRQRKGDHDEHCSAIVLPHGQLRVVVVVVASDADEKGHLERTTTRIIPIQWWFCKNREPRQGVRLLKGAIQDSEEDKGEIPVVGAP